MSIYYVYMLSRIYILITHLQDREKVLLRQAMAEERRKLLVSLHAREETMKEKYTAHIRQLEEKDKRRTDILISQHQSVTCHLNYNIGLQYSIV